MFRNTQPVPDIRLPLNFGSLSAKLTVGVPDGIIGLSQPLSRIELVIAVAFDFA